MNIAELGDRILDGDRRALARAITLVESGRADHRTQAARFWITWPGPGGRRCASGCRVRPVLANPPSSKASA